MKKRKQSEYLFIIHQKKYLINNLKHLLNIFLLINFYDASRYLSYMFR